MTQATTPISTSLYKKIKAAHKERRSNNLLRHVSIHDRIRQVIAEHKSLWKDSFDGLNHPWLFNALKIPTMLDGFGQKVGDIWKELDDREELKVLLATATGEATLVHDEDVEDCAVVYLTERYPRWGEAKVRGLSLARQMWLVRSAMETDADKKENRDFI